MLNVNEVQNIIPHRFPFLFLDRVEELEPGVRAVAVKNVTINEWFFQGHLPGFPLMPGVVMVEALAQLVALTLWSVPENKDKKGLFGGIDKFQFRKPVFPGDTLRLEVSFLHSRRIFNTFSASATVDGKLVASGEVTMVLTNAGGMQAP